MKQPSILVLISYRVFPALMGGQKCIASFYQELHQHCKVKLIVSKDNDLKATNGLDIEDFLYNHWNGFANIQYLFRLLKIIKTNQCQYLIIEHSYFGWLGYLIQLLSKTPFIIRVHNIEAHRFRDLNRNGWKLYYYYEKWICKRADKLWFTSPNDMVWMQENWKISNEKCMALPYGIDITSATTYIEKQACRSILLEKFTLNSYSKLFLFNGTLDYLPNTDAIRIIITELLPRLSKQTKGFRIFVCGNRITEQWEKELQKHPEIIYTGFVKDISTYFKGTDCFINPVTLGSGLKTKLVEALSYNQDIISVVSGAKGIEETYSGKKIKLVADYDWDAFVHEMMSNNLPSKNDTPEIFYTDFNWKHIVEKALLSIQS